MSPTSVHPTVWLPKLACVGVIAVLGCAGSSAENTTEVTIPHNNVKPSGYITQLATATIDSATVALSWTENTPVESRLWWCQARFGRADGLRVDRPPAIVDQGKSLQHITIFARASAPGVVYTKDNQLLYRWPLNTPPIPLTVPHEERIVSSTAAVLRNGDVIIAAIVSLIDKLPDRTHELRAYRIGSATAVATLASLVIPRTNLVQPPPHILQTGDSIVITALITGGRITDIADSTQGPIGSHGEAVSLRLSDGLALIDHARWPLPDDHDINFATYFAPINLAATTVVAGKPRLKVVVLTSPGEPTVPISSPVGLGSLFAIPSVQTLPQTDTSAVVAWIDTERQFGSLRLAEGSKDPTEAGGEIRARIVTQHGVLSTNPLPGFPIQTQAQCLVMGRLGNHLSVAWVDGKQGDIRVRLMPIPSR